MADAVTGRARLAELDAELARLRAAHDIAMSAFLFDEANGLQREIAALEERRRAFIAQLPPAAPPPEGAVPVMLKPRRIAKSAAAALAARYCRGCIPRPASPSSIMQCCDLT